MEDKQLEAFCNILRKRTQDHLAAAKKVQGIPSMMFSILRQELDSLVRVIYLLSISNLEERKSLINLTLNNEPWITKTINGKPKKITDREMVEISNQLMGWTRSVYKFGCAFIHLSNFHNYEEIGPLNQVNDIEKMDILCHMRQYHGGPISDNPSLEDIQHYLPKVLEKVSGNLECYIQELEKDTLTPISNI